VINFRYHVVSIVAVFLALAIGLVLGATELQGATLDALSKASSSLSSQLNASRAQNQTLQQQLNADGSFAQDSETRLLAGLLTGQRVVVVTAPGAPGSVINGITAAVQQAGASVTGQVNLQTKLLDASQTNQTFLSALVQGLVSPGSTAPNGSPLEQAAELLGGAILTKDDPSGSAGSGGSSSGSTDSGGAGDSGASLQAVLSSYAQGGLLSVSGPLSSSQTAEPATLAVIVIPASPPSGGDNDPANQGLITLAQGLDTKGLGTVMVGAVSGSVSGSAIDALRSSGASSQISTVDDADTLIGQIVTVQALQEAMAGHKAGSYGVDTGSNTAGPDPAPTPIVSTPSTTVKTTGSKDTSHGASDPATKSSKGRS
jgi:hypothetical protein